MIPSTEIPKIRAIIGTRVSHENLMLFIKTEGEFSTEAEDVISSPNFFFQFFVLRVT